jgi:hypothetical protein
MPIYGPTPKSINVVGIQEVQRHRMKSICLVHYCELKFKKRNNLNCCCYFNSCHRVRYSNPFISKTTWEFEHSY